MCYVRRVSHHSPKSDILIYTLYILVVANWHSLAVFTMLALSLASCAAGAAHLVKHPMAGCHEIFQYRQLSPTLLSSFIELESSVAIQAVLQNIGPNGTDVAGAASGVVVASPLKTNPNCKWWSSSHFLIKRTRIWKSLVS